MRDYLIAFGRMLVASAAIMALAGATVTLWTRNHHVNRPTNQVVCGWHGCKPL